METNVPEGSETEDLWRRGRGHGEAGRWEEAAACFQRIAEGDHDHSDALAAWGMALRAAKRKREAVAVLRQACALRPGDAELRCELGDAWQDLGYPREALPVYAEATRLAPALTRAWYAAGCAQVACGEFAAAVRSQREALRMAPEWSAARHNLGSALFKLGQVDEALDEFAEAARGPSPELSLAMASLVIPGSPRADNATILQARRTWVKSLGAEARGTTAVRKGRPAGRSVRPGKLRVGYVSSFFEKDNWMKPVWSLLNRHARQSFEIHLFSDAPAEAIKHGYAAHPDDRFHDISGRSNEAAATEITRAGLDLLVDLNGYSAPSRLPVYLRRPAPVIVGWFNLYATTGMPCFDYLIGDPVVIPPAEERYYVEKILRVPGSCLSFDVNYPVPEISSLQNHGNDAARFGCLAPLYKIPPPVIAAWSEILRRTPGATLLLKNTALGSADNRAFVERQFEKQGITAERLRLEGPAPHYEFLETYGKIDMALDTFPYNGGTTTTEAIWQGVPVVAFRGDRWVSRTSASILQAGGLGRFVTNNTEEYIRLAVELGTSPQARADLAELRREMRTLLRASPVCDAAAFAREMEGIYQRIC